jgi:hypothetical protein
MHQHEVPIPLVVPQPIVPAIIGKFHFVAWSSLLFAILQSICTFFVAMDALRAAVGIGSLVLAASTTAAIDAFHVDWLRIPMICLALAGSTLNLAILWQVRRLRAMPAAQWRQTPLPPKKLRAERIQFVLSLLTLVLIAIEERQHLVWAHHL